MVVPIMIGLSTWHKFDIMMIDNDMDEDKMPPPFIAVQLLGRERLETYAFINSGADGNTISYKLFKTLKNVHLSDIDVVFQS